MDMNVIEVADYDHAVSGSRDNGTNETVNYDVDLFETSTDKCIHEYVHATVAKKTDV